MELWKKNKLKLIRLIAFNLLIWIINSFLYSLPVVFKVAFTVFTTGGFLILALIDIFPIESWQGKRIFKNLILTLIYGIIFLGILWLYTAYYKFPAMFTITILIYTLLAVLFLVLIDLNPPSYYTGITVVNNLLFLFLI